MADRGIPESCSDKDFDFDVCIIQKLARRQGLTHDHLMQVVSAIESRNAFFKTFEKLDLIKCLIPSESIPEEAFIRMACLLSNLEFDINIKVEILKWMIAVYSFVESLNKFRLLYELFLQFLAQPVLQPYVCHLLYLLTNKSHVTRRRVKYLQKQIIEHGSRECLFFLYLVYYKQCPESFGVEVKESIEYHFHSLGNYPDLIKRVHPSYNINDCVYISTYEADSCDTASCLSSEIEGSALESDAFCEFREIFQELETLKKTKDISKILRSKYRRLFLTSDMPVVTKIKIYDYIISSLYDEENFTSRDFLLNILDIFHDMQGSMVAVSDFTEYIISSGNFTTNLDINIAILQYQPICCFQQIIYKMDLIREYLFKADVHTKCELLYCFSKMYENWFLLEYDRYSSIKCFTDCFISDSNTLCPSGSISDDFCNMSHEPKDEMSKLRLYIDLICNTLIRDDTLNPCLLNEILLHYERMSIMHIKKYGPGTLHLPTYQVFGTSLFSFSSLTLDNLCHLMLRYNNEVIKMCNEEHEDSIYAMKNFKLYRNDIDNFLFEGSNENTILSKVKVFKKLKELYPKVEDLLSLHSHPAILTKIDSFFKKYSFAKYKSEGSSSARKDFLKYLSDDGLQYLTKLESLVNNVNILKKSCK